MSADTGISACRLRHDRDWRARRTGYRGRLSAGISGAVVASKRLRPDRTTTPRDGRQPGSVRLGRELVDERGLRLPESADLVPRPEVAKFRGNSR